MRLTNACLKNFFLDVNRTFFNNELNKNTVVKFANLKPNLMGISKTRVKTITRKTTAKERRENNLPKNSWAIEIIPGIFISNDFRNSKRQTGLTLLHEMAHQSLSRKRDKRGYCNSEKWNAFNRRMLKLAKAGALNGWW
jgi:hypothetical protein